MTDVPEMVERVARAICAAAGALWQDDDGTEFNCLSSADCWRRDARAAIEAMREPTENQLYQAWKATDGAVDRLEGCRRVWAAMIESALG